MSHPHRFIALAALVACGAAFAAGAQTRHAPRDAQQQTGANNPPQTAPAPSAPKPFEELDANADGAISKDEAAVDPPLAQAFGTLDVDADGRLTPEEYAVYAQGQP